MTHAVGLALVTMGCVVAALASVAALAVRGDVFLRLHYLSPVTSVAAPLVAVGLCVESGQPYVIAELLVIALMLFATGPVLESATARVAGQDRGLVQEEQPP